MSKVADILKQMEKQRQGRPIRVKAPSSPPRGEAYSTRVRPVKTPEKSKASVKKPQCDKFSRVGFGASAMTVEQLKEFIKTKAPEPVFRKFSRMQKKTRPELCKLLSEFEAGYRLLYPANAPAAEAKNNNIPNVNNIEGMLNFAEGLYNRKLSKNVKKVANVYDPSGFYQVNNSGSPSSVSSTPGTPNFVNYNNTSNEEQRMRNRNMYLRRLAEKRVVRDPMESNLSAANIMRMKLQPLKNSRSTGPTRKPRAGTPPKLMNFGGNNMRKPTVTTRGLKVSTSPRVTAAQMRRFRNNAADSRDKLSALLKTLENVNNKKKTPIVRYRIRILKKILNDPSFENKFIEKRKYRETLEQRLGLKSPPRVQSPKKAFSMSRGSLRANQNARLRKMMTKKSAPETKVDATAIKGAINRYMSFKNINNFKIEGKKCMTISKPKLIKMLRAVTKDSIKNPSALTKEEICKIIKEKIKRTSK